MAMTKIIENGGTTNTANIKRKMLYLIQVNIVMNDEPIKHNNSNCLSLFVVSIWKQQFGYLIC